MIEVRDLHKRFGSVEVLKGIDLDVEAGRVVCVIGPSGSGKSTLLRLLACVDRPDQGSIQIDGVETATLSRAGRVRLRRRKLGFMFQAPADNLLGYLTVRQHLRLATQLRGLSTHDSQAPALLDRLGLAGRADNLPKALSGGEQQRLAIAFASIGPPALLVADEPTGQLDHSIVDTVLDGTSYVVAHGQVGELVPREVTLGINICAGRVEPRRRGPTVIPSHNTFIMWKVTLAAW